MSNSILGIDVAKLKLDVALLHDGNTVTHPFVNSPESCTALQTWLSTFPLDALHACL